MAGTLSRRAPTDRPPLPSQIRSFPARPPRRPARAAGAQVVLVAALPVLHIERGGRAMQVLCRPRIRAWRPRCVALAEHVRAGQGGRLALQRIDGEPVLGGPWEGALAAVGFHVGPRRLTFSA